MPYEKEFITLKTPLIKQIKIVFLLQIHFICQPKNGRSLNFRFQICGGDHGTANRQRHRIIDLSTSLTVIEYIMNV